MEQWGRFALRTSGIAILSIMVFCSGLPVFAKADAPSSCIVSSDKLGEPGPQALKSAFPKLTPGTYHIVFFATWCAACKKSLEAMPGSNSILIGTLDEQVDLQRAYALLGRGLPCLIDEDGQWFKALGGKSLPFKTQLEL